MNDTSVSRLYYAAFYSVNALLATEGFNPKTHCGSKTIFNKEFILPGKIDGRFSDFYSFLMAKRAEADYDDFVFIDEIGMPALFAQTEEFVFLIASMINDEV